MKKLLAILFVLLLSGCSTPLPRIQGKRFQVIVPVKVYAIHKDETVELLLSKGCTIYVEAEHIAVGRLAYGGK